MHTERSRNRAAAQLCTRAICTHRTSCAKASITPACNVAQHNLSHERQVSPQRSVAQHSTVAAQLRPGFGSCCIQLPCAVDTQSHTQVNALCVCVCCMSNCFEAHENSRPMPRHPVQTKHTRRWKYSTALPTPKLVSSCCHLVTARCQYRSPVTHRP